MRNRGFHMLVAFKVVRGVACKTVPQKEVRQAGSFENNIRTGTFTEEQTPLVSKSSRSTAFSISREFII
jgi:hypothetical protein